MAINKNNASDTDAKTAAVETADQKQTEKLQYEGITNFVYAGPSLPGGRLKSLSVLGGTYAEIIEYYKEAIALYPSVARLIVPVATLAEVRKKTQKSGNSLYNYFNEIIKKMKGDEQ